VRRVRQPRKSRHTAEARTGPSDGRLRVFPDICPEAASVTTCETMARDDLAGEPVVGGTWLYDGVPKRIVVLAYNFDLDYYWALDEVRHVRETHGSDMPEPPPPRPLGPDGVLYRVAGSPAFDTLVEAKALADSQPWGPVRWED